MLGVAHVVQLTHFELPNVLLLNVGCVIFCFFFFGGIWWWKCRLTTPHTRCGKRSVSVQV